MTVEQVARICRDANGSLCASVGDFSRTSREQSPDWRRESAVRGVEFHPANPDADASATHEGWLKEKAEAGWVYGEVKDAVAGTHPCSRG